MFIDQRGVVVQFRRADECNLCIYYDGRGWGSCKKKIPAEHINESSDLCIGKNLIYQEVRNVN